jgi:alkylation response protein AidB-like acyl-CoA dehydrogenase
MVTTARKQVLTQDILDRCRERAPRYDRDNNFFAEDFEELKNAGYLNAAVPRELGGLGMTLAEIAQEQRRLAYHAAPTALAVNMHFYWTGVAADVWRSGDKSVEWMLTETVNNGAVFAAGHAEPGNDIPVLLSTTRAERVEGGYRFTGRKSFGSLTPVWTYLGLHGLDTSDPNAPKVVHAFMPRGTAGSAIVDVWDTLGMRATQSQDTVLDGAFVPDRYIPRVVSAGAAGIDLFVIGIFAWALLGFANIYYGNAQNMLDQTIAALKTKTSIALTRPMIYHPEIQHEVAEMVMEMEAIQPHIEKIAQDWCDGVDHGHNWGLKIIAAKYRAVHGAWKVVDKCLDLQGGFGIFKQSGIERIWRDARLGLIHPANSALAHEFIGKTALGISPDEQPRWG